MSAGVARKPCLMTNSPQAIMSLGLRACPAGVCTRDEESIYFFGIIPLTKHFR